MKGKTFTLGILICVLYLLSGCGKHITGDSEGKQQTQIPETHIQEAGEEEMVQEYQSMNWEEAYSMEYAKGFRVEKSGDYRRITIPESEEVYLVVPKGMSLPAELPKEVVVLKQPLSQVYLASSSVFDYMELLDCLDAVAFSGTRQEDLDKPGFRERMAGGKMVYAGKYDVPDYELLYGNGCTLAIENTMIYHTPETREKLEQLGITVMVELSSREKNPLGRMEWIKLYGTLFQKEKEACDYFDSQVKNTLPYIGKNTELGKVAVFSVNANGTISVRRPGDYISEMIEMVGGEYFLESSEEAEESTKSTMNMNWEEFYLSAKDADVIIYNGIMDGGVETLEEFLSLHPLFADFAAVEKHRVFNMDRGFYQEPSGIACFMTDISNVLNREESNLTYLKKMN